jgi:hypothetical protein
MNRRSRHRPNAPSLCLFIALGAAVLAAASPVQSPSTLDDKEHGPVEPHGIEINWAGGPAETFYAELAQPVVTLRLVNRDRVGYTVRARTLEDAGSLQTRRLGSPLSASLAAGGQKKLAISFGGAGLQRLTHSGMVLVAIEACPVPGGRCIGGTSYPLFFHAAAGRVLVYGEKVLCSRFRCGALNGQADLERGTWRVMGGGPLHGVSVAEEPPGSEDRAEPGVVDGGAQ